jgi:hypothetical protein
MGWKGTLRSIESSLKRAAREAERDSKRRHRELVIRHKELAKLEAKAQAAYEVEAFENLLDRLTTMHKEPVETPDWMLLAKEPPPVEPTKSKAQQSYAEEKLRSFKPSFFDRIFKRAEKSHAKLITAIDHAKKKDEDEYQTKLRRYRSKLSDWEERTHFSRRMLDGDFDAFREAIESMELFAEIKEFGSQIDITISRNATSSINLKIHGETVIPKEKKALLQSGKVSAKNMPVGEFYAHFQDHVCSTALRAANELLAVIPIDMVIVTVTDKLLDSATGHLIEQPILSVKIPRQTLQSLNLPHLDASDSMRNFVHNMDFKKTKGFAPVVTISE